MAKIAYILLCHKDPEAIIAHAERLTAKGDMVSIHFDARSDDADFAKLQSALGSNPNVTFGKRVKCGWGEWSLVAATLSAINAALRDFPDFTHFYMVSGDCMPIKSAEYLHAFLDNDDRDFIESFDFFHSDWIKTGVKEERLYYRYFVNERKHKKLFYALLDWQKKLGLKRKLPQGVKVMVGSQWWCLRRRTVEAILEFLKTRPDVTRFFKYSWIPDETFFQTLVRHLVPHKEIDPRTLTFLMFSDYGMPVTFFNDHYELLKAQNFMFARKISPEATDLKERLSALYASGETEFAVSGEGRNLYHFTTQQGRVGRRFGERFWERESSLGRERELLVLVCKKWRVARNLQQAISKHAKIPGIGFLYEEEDAGLPDLGGLEKGRDKRTRHRRSFLRLVFEHFRSDRLVICVDPKNLDPLHDFNADRCTMRVLEIKCAFSDEFLAGHAQRLGLAGHEASGEALQKVIPTLRNEIAYESERLREAGFAHLSHLAEGSTGAERAAAVSAFLNIPTEVAEKIVRTRNLFAE